MNKNTNCQTSLRVLLFAVVKTWHPFAEKRLCELLYERHEVVLHEKDYQKAIIFRIFTFQRSIKNWINK